MSRKYELAALLCLMAASPAATWAEAPAPAAAKNAEAEYWLRIGKQHYTGMLAPKNHHKALEAFEKAAAFDVAEAYYFLGNLYHDSPDITADEEKAQEYYRMAAEKGHPDSQMLVGVFHVMEGIARRPDSPEQKAAYKTAIQWLAPAAEKGVPEAKFWYGDMMMKGLGTEKDEAKGLSLIREAAEAGNPNGQAMLGALHWLGQSGLEKDLHTAYLWVSRSKAAGNENADAMLKRISAEMTPAQREKAQKAVDALLKERNNTP